MSYIPKTKIICTIGPASNSPTVIRKMMRHGMDAVRLNFSHGNLRDRTRCIETVRVINKKYHRRIRIIGDLQGHRIRIGRLRGGKPVELRKRQVVRLVQTDACGEGDRIPFDYKGPLSAIKSGNVVYIDDGNIALSVTKKTTRALTVKVIRGGVLKERKGVNIPDAVLLFPLIANGDIPDIAFAMKNKLDFIAMSFVRSERDVAAVRGMIGGSVSGCRIISKIENRQGIRNIDEIIDISDGIMIARGDMGISVPLYEVPIIQKRIIKKCRTKRKFVITATQMFESMTEHALPTRAEVSDVANAIIDGTDYVMLSGETAVGKYPVEAVDMMNKVVAYTERNAP